MADEDGSGREHIRELSPSRSGWICESLRRPSCDRVAPQRQRGLKASRRSPLSLTFSHLARESAQTSTMPSIRVKTGYQPLERPPPDGRGRTSSFAALFRPASASDTPQQSEPKSTTLRHAKSWNPDAALQSQDASRPPLQRPRASSKVSTHIMSTTRQSRTPRINPPETPLAGPSTQPESEEGAAGAGGSSLLLPQAYLRRRPYPDSYTVQGQQADLRVPTDEGRGLEGSQVNLALERLEDNYESNDDPLETHHHDDIVEHLDVIGASQWYIFASM